jgi:mannose-binding lectin 2
LIGIELSATGIGIMRLPSLSAILVAACAWNGAAAQDEPEVKSISLRTHTLVQPYLDSDMQSRWFDFGGDTIVRTDSYIRLTTDRPSQEGWLFSRVPLTATNWEVEVEFKISGKNQLYGDGFAMWVTKGRGLPGPVFGHADKFEGLGIFIDTYKNNRPGVVFPYVMAMHGDGQTSYDKNTDGKSTELAGCSARGIRNAQVPTKLRLTYFQDKYLKLELQYKTEDEWQVCFDHPSPPAIPNIAYLGFSAETGELSDNHDIISVRSKNLYTNPGTRPSSPGKGRNQSKGGKVNSAGKSEGGTWTWFFVKVFLFVAVLGGAYVGFTAYRAKSKSHRF